MAGIDINPALIGSRIGGVEIYAPDRLESLVQELSIKIGIIAVPVESAQDIADLAARSGIKAIWNFTPSRIRVPEGVVISNTSIYSHLAVMYNRLATISDSKR